MTDQEKDELKEFIIEFLDGLEKRLPGIIYMLVVAVPESDRNEVFNISNGCIPCLSDVLEDSIQQEGIRHRCSSIQMKVH